MRASVHERLFRALLRLLPAAFRSAYGDEMTELFRVRLERARAQGAVAVAALWMRTAADLVPTALAERSGGGGGWTLDVKHAARRLLRAPVFTAAAVLILAVGIGANTAAFSIVDAAVLRPPPFERPDEVVFVYQDSDDGEPSSSAYPAYLDVAASDVFAGVAATSLETVTWETDAGPRPAAIEYATSSFLPVLGLAPARGRWFTADEDQVGAGLYAVVSHRTWRQEMGGDESVLGSTVRLNGQPVTIVGVGPERFNGAGGGLALDFWLSISTTPVGGDFRVANLERREDHWYDVVARLAPGVTATQAQAAMDALALRMGEAYPELDRGRGITVFGVGEVRFNPETDGILVAAGTALMGVVGLVLLLACANLANLLLVRGVARGQEMAVRQALGAGRGRLARLFLLEAVVLCAVGASAGLLLAGWLVDLVPLLPLPLPAGTEFDVAVDGRVVTFGAALALATALVFGLLPAARQRGSDVAGSLREDGRSASGGRVASRLRSGLVAVQVAVSLVLLIGAGLVARSLANARSVDPGFDAERLALMLVDASQVGVAADAAPAMLEELRQRVLTLPGVTGAAFTSRPPVQGGGTTTTVIEGYASPAGTDAVELSFAYVTPSYFETLGVELVAGRGFGPDDRPETDRVVVMNEAAADAFWNGDAVGKRVRSQGADTPWREVVGVVGDTKVRQLQEPATPMMYFSLGQIRSIAAGMTLVARTDGDPEQLLAPLRGALAQVAPGVSPDRLTTFEAHLGDALSAPRVLAALMAAFSLIALLLATLGVYAVVSFATQRRASELGIRVALGADRGRIVGMVVAQSLLPVALGVLVGLGIARGVAPSLEGVLFGVGAGDALAYLGAAALLLAVGAGAALIPAWRAVRADPVDVLRTS